MNQTSVTMKIVYSNCEFKPGTLLRRIYLYEDDGDVIMTDGPVYEDDDSDKHRDGPAEEDDDEGDL